MSKHMRLPNGFGQITKIKNKKLRNPYRAMVTVGTKDNGRPIVKLLKPVSYFKTYNDAYYALMKYHEDPYDYDNQFTLKDIYSKWTSDYFKSCSNSTCRTIKAAWSRCSDLYDVDIKNIRPMHIKSCIDKEPSSNMKMRIKSMFNLIFDYAMEYEIVDKNCSRSFNVSKYISDDSKKEHMVFSNDEINKLWASIKDIEIADIILIQCYTGWRPKELCEIKISDVNLEDMYIKGGVKTYSGKNRIVPIHHKIEELIINRYKEAVDMGSDYLFCVKTFDKNNLLTYDKLRHRFNRMVNELKFNPNHRLHDGRKHFITKAKECGVDEYAIKYIVGHSINDITEKVYTDRTVEWLKTEIQKIK